MGNYSNAIRNAVKSTRLKAKDRTFKTMAEAKDLAQRPAICKCLPSV